MEAAEQLKGEDRPDGAGASPVLPSEAARRRAAVELVRNHRTLLMASARRVSLCVDDAEDAFQRGLEILLSKAPTADTRRLLPWARTVIRNEALLVRRTRERTLGRPSGVGPESGREGEERDWVGALPSDGRPTEEVVEGRELVARSREALALLKPQELKALTQLASGMSYAEIASTNGWTRTKVNRCLAEGREKLRSVVSESEAGERCRLIEPLISPAADGELEPEVAAEVRNHLAVCGGCRATLREFRRIPAAVVAAGAVPLATGAPGGEAEAPGLVFRALDRFDELSVQAWFRLNGLFGGGDAAAPVLGAGGARGSGTALLAKVAAICVGTAGGAAACLGTGLVAIPGERDVEKPPPPVRVEAASRTVDAPTSPTPAPIAPPDGGQPDEVDQVRPEPPPPDPVAAEFSPVGGAPVTTSPPAPASTAVAPQPAKPAGRVPLGGSGEFGP